MDWQDFIDFIDSIGEYNNLIPSVQVFVAGVYCLCYGCFSICYAGSCGCDQKRSPM